MEDPQAFLAGLSDFTDEPPRSIAADILRSYLVNPPTSIPREGDEVAYDISDRLWSSSEYSPSTSTNGIRWDEIGTWPQRLLHVPSMTSYEWTPGNLYGGHVAPKYNAVSYTWGRYNIDHPSVQADNALRPDRKMLRETRRMNIAGIEWEDALPRINPKHYTLHEFRRFINATCRLGRKGKDDGEGGGEEEVQFLWLDLACIDQQDGPQKMEEIGRQAGIYRGAEAVFIWLTTAGEERLKQAMEDLRQCAERALQLSSDDLADWFHHTPPEDQMLWLRTSRSALDELFIDPWFTSIWTLQEGYLGPNAYLVTREAICPLIQVGPDSTSPVKATLGHLCQFASTIERACQRQHISARIYWNQIKTSPLQRKRLKYLDEIPGMLAQRGIAALASRNPIALLGAAYYRKTIDDHDQVYGIQQIFNLRLNVGGQNRKIPAVALENQLGVRILKSYPVLSQMHVYTLPVSVGRGWRVSAASSVPNLDLRTELPDLALQVDCKLSTVNADRMQWGFFEGRICGFEPLAEAWSVARNIGRSRSLQQICLDALETQGVTMEYQIPIPSPREPGFEPRYPSIWGFSTNILRDERQNDVAAWVLKNYPHRFPGTQLMVLRLGFFYDIPKDEEVTSGTGDVYRVGLILVESQFNGRPYWKRLGFCIWECPQSRAFPGLPRTVFDVLDGRDDSNSWTEANGMFG